MRSGDVKPLDDGNAISLILGAWAEKHGNYLEIHLTGDGELFSHTTVNNNPASPRYHRTIFRNLRRVLIANGRWPYGNEGREAEEENRVDQTIMRLLDL